MRAGLFPGQGSQTADMPVDTAGQQPAVFRRSVENFRASGIECEWFAGHSLGSYSALVAAGALGFDDGDAVVTVRGRAMADASAEHPGSMIALLGATPERARELAGEFGLTVANDNAPGQLVLSGATSAIDSLELAEPDAGDGRRLRVKRLPVSGAFHSALMAPAAIPLTAAIARASFGDASRVIANGSAQPYSDPAAELAAELLLPVRFRESLLRLWELGVREFVEFEPAGVLTGLVKRTLPDARAVKITDLVAAG